MVLCLKWSCYCTCIVRIALWELLGLWWFFLKQVPSPMLWVLFFSHFLLFLNVWSISFHSFLVFHILSLAFGPLNISLPCAFSPFYAFFMHTKCFWSSLHMLSLLSMCFLCTLSVFNLYCMYSMNTSMHVRCYQSPLHAFYAC